MKKALRAFENKDIGTINSLILHHYINPNDLIPTKGVSLLHLIIGHQSENFAFRITKLFLRCGGDPNVQSSDGVTPTHVAAAWGRNRILHLLLVNGGDPWVQDDEKKNAFNYAFEEREWNTIEMLHHFQQMHSAANFQSEIDMNPKYKFNLERVLVRKGEDMFAYAPLEKSTKTTTTQTQSSVSDTPSPIQDKIKYFEPTSGSEINCWKKPEKLEIGWPKDFYQTSCEVVVHCDPSKQPENKEEKKETFISSVHIESLMSSDSVHEKSPPNTSSMDVRSQLFVELQEAVRRRSKLKVGLQEPQIGENSPGNSFNSESVIVISNDSSANISPVTKQMTKQTPHSFGIDLESSGMLKSMSDFATKVMKEVEVIETNPGVEKAIDLGVSSPEVTNTYLSCEDEPCTKSETPNIQTVTIPQCNSDTSNLYLTPYNSNVNSGVNDVTNEGNSNESFVSVTEEYKYTDVEEGVVLLEKKLLVTPTISMTLEGAVREESNEEDDVSNVSSIVTSISSSTSYNSDILRCELKGLGYNPGPVTKTTKKLYLKKLWRLKKAVKRTQSSEKENYSPVRSHDLGKTLTSLERFEAIPTYEHLEEEMCRSFEKWTKRKWREGTNKTSFNYLLLDPRVSANLPKRASRMTAFEIWKCFLSAIFYVGKGKRSRPYAHLYQAAGIWEQRGALDMDEKTERIVKIWKEGLGVVCLQIFQNIIPVEAYTREAAMIDALSLENLKNARSGEYYGVASTWPTRDKVNLGNCLLHKAMQIFLNEGEKQIKPYDID